MIKFVLLTGLFMITLLGMVEVMKYNVLYGSLLFAGVELGLISWLFYQIFGKLDEE